MDNLYDVAVIKKILARHGFSFSKSLGQNFITDPSVCPRMADECFTSPDGCVIEIGAGMGVLTKELALRFNKVASFEIDTSLIPVLAETLKGLDNVNVINDDILKTDLRSFIDSEFGDLPVSVCANLPYYITSPIIMYLLESRIPFENITVMIQKEAADRLCDRVGGKNSGAITAAVNYYAEPEKLFDVGKNSFMPPPKVDSSVIKLKVRKEPPVSVRDEKSFFRLIRASFCQRRKTAVNSISAGLGIPKSTVSTALSELGFDAGIRAERFTLEDFSRL
ncbi:MAG: 16S rRNA (adenine(1518)-N(6)/adenine(1519)-N(6))-dimethyltransferase RsmA, partial [Clostridiales bacterium]|nr:16S rRNA (adenine(1518)-N(6)/adenine(1519)-N(6))-dimethyltransferase RsmA [Clostridiales bacterium]